MSAVSVGPHGSPRRYFHSLWLLSSRDLKVRYATNALGYVWSILDPLLMGLIYWFVFGIVFERSIGEEPYIVYLMLGVIPWTWFTAAVNDATNAFTKDKKLVRSTGIPNSIWVGRVSLTTMMSFFFSVPVVLAFVAINYQDITFTWGLLWIPVAVLIQLVLITGLSLILAPLCVLLTDLARTTKLALRVGFYASPILYSPNRLPEWADWVERVNPVYGILTLYRVGIFPDLWSTPAVIASASISVATFAIGVLIFPMLIRPVLKDL